MKKPKIDLYRPYDSLGRFKPSTGAEAKRLSILKRKRCGACGHEYALHNGSLGCQAGKAELVDGGRVGMMSACYCKKFERKPGDKI